MPSRKAAHWIVIASLVPVLIVAAIPAGLRFLYFLVLVLMTPLAVVVLPGLFIMACLLLRVGLGVLGWSRGRAWGGAVIAVGVVFALLITDVRMRPLRAGDRARESGTSEGLVGRARKWVLVHGSPQQETVWAPADIQKAYTSRMVIKAEIVERRGDHLVVKGTVTNNGKGVVRQMNARLEAIDADNRQFSGWTIAVPSYRTEHFDGESTPLGPGESREFTFDLTIDAWELEKGDPREPFRLVAVPTDTMVEKHSE